jgi:peptide/nickel transport system permease protein
VTGGPAGRPAPLAVNGQEMTSRGLRIPRTTWTGMLARAMRTWRGRIGAGLVGLVIGIAVLGPLVAPHSPTQFVTLPYAAPSRTALLGGDTLGRDVLSRLLDGGWEVLAMAAAATLIGVGLGLAAGLAAAYLRGATDSLIMRAADVLLAFPQLIFALLLVSVLGPQIWLVVLAVALAHAPQAARVIRAAALEISEQDFIKAAEILGVRRSRILIQEILPSLSGPVMVEAGLRLAGSVVIIASLSFIGFGIQPPAPNWGTMISENRIGLAQNPLAVAAPALLLVVIAIGLNMLTDAIAQASAGIAQPAGGDARRKPIEPEGVR